jgi:hypothetical protein
MNEIKNLHEQVFVNNLRAEMNGKACAIIDSFSGWLLSGFAASSALLVSQYDSVSKHLVASTIQAFLFLFLWSLIFGIIQKYLAVLVMAHSQGSSVGRDLGEKAAKRSIKLDFEIILSEMEKTILPPARWLVSRSYNKLKNGDLVSSTRNFSRLLQIQGMLAIIQAILMLIAIFKVASSFHA